MTRILLVDDHLPVRTQLRSRLEECPTWKVYEAANGQEAVSMHSEKKPELVIMDFNMPIMNGLQASEAIINRTPQANILMITVYTSRQLMEEAKKVGIRGFCAKSNMSCLTDAIQAILSGQTYFPEPV